jgi:hypothetical protein
VFGFDSAPAFKLGVGFGEVGFPFRRRRELLKKRIERRSLWRRVAGEGRGWEENVKEVASFRPMVEHCVSGLGVLV